MREIIQNKLRESLNFNSIKAYHGSNTEINNFTDEFVGGRDATDQNGPGIYFTTSKDEAELYGKNVYEVILRPNKIVSTDGGKNASIKEIEGLILNAPDWEDTAMNWSEDPRIGYKKAAKDFIKYNENPHQQFLQVWYDFYRDNPVDYVRNMVKLGYDAVVINDINPNSKHIVVLNPAIIDKEIKEVKVVGNNTDLTNIKEKVSDLNKNIEDRYPIKLDLYYNKSSNAIILSRIIVDEEERDKGIGKKVMSEICNFADRYNIRIALTPDSSFGGSKNRLIKFYKDFGFKNYKGFEFRETMVREPINQLEMLREASIDSFDNDIILSDKFIKNFIKSEDLADDLLDWFIEDEGLDYDEREKISLSREFQEYVKEELERHLNDAKDNIYDKIDYDSGKIRLYRAITVDDKWLEHLKVQGKRLGIYWSWDENSAETHWGDVSKKNIAVIEAEIDEKNVDWLTTFKMNMHPHYSEEKEIRLFKNTPIKIKGIELNGDIIDISGIKDKVFRS